MTISSETRRNDYTGNGAVDTYSYTFRILDDDDLLVTVRDTDDEEATLTKTTHYTVTGVGADGGGSIVLVNGAFDWLDGDGDLESGYRLTIRRVVDIIQETDIRNQGSFFPETHEDEFDRQVMIDQQQQDELDRSVKLPETVASGSFSPTLPTDILDGANKVPLVNSDGDGWADAADWPTADEIANADTSATDAATSATAAATSATAAASSASAAATSATAAAASATAAAASVAAQLWQDVSFQTSNFSVVDADRGKLFAVDATGGAVTVTLPQISALTLSDPWAIGIKKTDSSGNSVTINRAGTDTIDGGTSKTITVADSGTVLIPDTDTAPDEWTSADFGSGGGSLTVDRFSGDGADTTFVLSVDPGSENNTLVYVDGVYQQKNTYSLSGTTLTFSAAPPIGTDNIEVISGTTQSIGVPNDASVTTAKLANSVLDGLTAVTAVSGDYVAISDTSDSGNAKKALISDITALVGGTAIANKTGDYTLTSSDFAITADASGGSFTLTLPAAASNSGRIYHIKRTDMTLANTVTIDGNASETIDGDTTRTLHTQYESYTIMSNGSNWIILDHKTATPWTSYTMTIGGTTSAPTKGTIDVDTAVWSRDGADILIMYNYRHNGGSMAAGSGSYLFPLPSGVTADTTALPAHGGGTSILRNCGACSFNNGSTEAWGVVVLYNNGNLALAGGNDGTTITLMGSAWKDMAQTDVRITFTARIPVSGWSP